jgi:pimeloyl-ACP methyl ester carboxylesterase
MPEIQRGEAKVYYEVHGSGEPVVALRGLGRSIRHWLGFEKTLAKSFQVILIDLRGIGRSKGTPGWNLSLDDMARDVLAVMDELNLQRAHMLGVSLGGMVALSIGLLAPERCKSVVTINTSVGGLGGLRISPRAAATLLVGGALVPLRHKLLSQVLVSRRTPRATRARLALEWQQIEAEEGSPAQAVARQLLAALRFRPRKQLKQFKVPTLIIYGLDDQFTPNPNSHRLGKLIPNCRIVGIAGGGHELTLDCPDSVVIELKRWVDDMASL